MNADFKIEKHGPWRQLKRIGREYCGGCGLVRLHNPLTDWCLAKGCNYEAHPGYQSAVRTMTTQRSESP